MKAILLSAMSVLVAARPQSSSVVYPPAGAFGAYPKDWVDFNGGDTSANGEKMKQNMGNFKPPPQRHPTGGTGQYKASVFEEPSLKGHTIYAPKELPQGKKLPLLLWGNGGCLALGQTHGSVLMDIASHGYVVIANGVADAPEVFFSKNTDMFDAALWAAKEGAKYNIDAASVASAGQSCGGMQAYTGNQAPGIKTSIIFNSGLLGKAGDLRSKLSKTLKGTILYMEGGNIDVGYANVRLREAWPIWALQTFY
jgi:acetyl esterase/lipase